MPRPMFNSSTSLATPVLSPALMGTLQVSGKYHILCQLCQQLISPSYQQPLQCTPPSFLSPHLLPPACCAWLLGSMLSITLTGDPKNPSLQPLSLKLGALEPFPAPLSCPYHVKNLTCMGLVTELHYQSDFISDFHTFLIISGP